MKIPFDEKELEIVEVQKTHRGEAPVYNYPVTPREGWRAMLDKQPIWLVTGTEQTSICPDVLPENRARGFVTDTKYTPEELGGLDMFGLKWVFDPEAGGSMIEHGAHLFENANDWKNALEWPDIDAWDWAASGEKNRAVLDNNKMRMTTLHNGAWFERLISFMGFENALLALIDKKQQQAIHDILDRTTDLFCRLVDKFCEYYDLDGFTVHDDWGSQKGPIFSPKIGREMLVPHMRKLTDHIHAKGKIAELHSCGKMEAQVPNFIAAGWDSWGPMAINDTHALYEQYGDQIVIGVMPDPYDPQNSTPEEQRAEARKFVDAFGKPGTGCIVSRYAFPLMTPAWREELYRYSRQTYAAR